MSLPPRLELLAKELEKDEPRVVIVIGAGVSQGATSLPQASWRGLLEHGIKYLVETGVFRDKHGKELKASLDDAFSPTFELEKALKLAELIEQNLNALDPKDFKDWLEAAFGNFTIRPGKGETLAAIRNVQQAGALLLTTNYDSLLTEETGLPPVTRKEHTDFLRVINRKDSGILHIHGHWKTPNSVVLGDRSYREILEDEDLQTAFRSLWLHSSWLFVGCGNGLDDPNIGGLLEWGKRWGGDAQPDYVLTRTNEARALEARSEKPEYLVPVEYAEHANLPSILNSLTPAARPGPFVPINEEFHRFRHPNSSEKTPFPSWQEYLAGEVPTLKADSEVRRRLDQHGWAFLLGLASVGKTTLALRVATAEHNRPTFYLDMATLEDGDARGRARQALRRLSRNDYLLILDNVHHHPEYARRLWDWHRKKRSLDSRLLLVATRIQHPVMTDPSQDFAFIEHHDTNPAVELRSTPEYLGRVMQRLYRRFPNSAVDLEPPQTVLRDWHHVYRSALSAFCLAVLERLPDLRRGNWELPSEAASDWVREKWLDKLNAKNRENVLSIAVFSDPKMELQVPKEALPYPGHVRQLLRLGLVAKAERGQFNQHLRFSLRDPGWGRLILAAQIPSVDEDEVRYETAARDPMLAAYLSTRLKRRGLDRKPLWDAVVRNMDQFAEAIWETPLGSVADLFRAARRHRRVTNSLWGVIKRQPKKFAKSARRTSLDKLAYFLNTVEGHGRDTDPLWDAIESDLEKLVESAWRTPLHFLASFLNTMQDHRRDADLLWDAIEKRPERLAKRAWETPLNETASFLNAARDHGRKTEPLWKAIESDLEKLTESAWQTPPDNLAYFLNTARKHKRETERLWEIIKDQPEKFAEHALKRPLNEVASFLNTMRQHRRDAKPLWQAIESDRERLVESVWQTSLGKVAVFLNTVRDHGRETEQLWGAIESDLEKLTESAWQTPPDNLAHFFNTAREHKRETERLWEAIEGEPERLAGYVLEWPLDQIVSFLNTAEKHERETEQLWEAIEDQPERLSATAQRSSTTALAGFCRHAPPTVIEAALSGFQADHWDGIHASESLAGGTWVASRCAGGGREDLKSALVTVLLRRANPRDFSRDSALKDVAWLIKNTSPEDSALVPAFLDALCTREWLRPQFAHAGCGSLASGLRMLGLHQPLWICQRFVNTSLDTRLHRELSYFSRVSQEERSQIIQLLGCADLCGWDVMAPWLEGAPLNQVSALPVDALSHRPDATEVEKYQFQLWLGLRTVVSETGRMLNVPADVINRTLDLWKNNLAVTSQEPESIAHRVNQSMVAWLEKCSRSGRLLPPDRRLK